MSGFQLNFVYLMAIFLSISLYMQRRINKQINSQAFGYFKGTLITLLTVGLAVLVERFAAYFTHSLILTPFIIPIVSQTCLYWYYKVSNSLLE